MVASSLNLNSLTIDSNGRVSFSGLSSGIDFQKAVDAIIAAKKIPIDTMSTKVDTNSKQDRGAQEPSDPHNQSQELAGHAARRGQRRRRQRHLQVEGGVRDRLAHRWRDADPPRPI